MRRSLRRLAAAAKALAMVSDTAAAYGGELRISASEDLGGARVEVRLPGRSLAASA